MTAFLARLIGNLTLSAVEEVSGDVGVRGRMPVKDVSGELKCLSPVGLGEGSDWTEDDGSDFGIRGARG